MPKEPSWEDIFNPDPTPEEPEAAPRAEPAAPQASSQQDTQRDPFADLFASPRPAADQPLEVQYPPTAVQPTVDPAQQTPAHQTAAQPTSPSMSPPSDDPVPGAPFDPFADIFGSASVPAASSSSEPTQYRAAQAFPTGSVEAVPLSRREAREAEGRRRAETIDDGAGGRGNGGGGRRGGGSGDGTGASRPKKKRSLLWLKITLPIVLILGAAGGVAAYGWFNYNEQVRDLLGIPLPTDYEGTGNGEEVIVSVRSGDIGSDLAVSLHEAGVTLTYDAVYDYLVANPDISFIPGNWRLQKEMSAESAVAALQDPANKVTDKLLITEGTVLPNALDTIAATTGLPLADVQAAALDVGSFGLPPEATTLEGFLFPATYDLDGTETAHDILQKMVNEMLSRLDAAGVAPDQRWNTVIMASIIQREAGSNVDDFYKVSRVFANRIAQGINLESDATVAYGTGRLDSVWTEPEEREDPSNLYNTYANPGLPIGPIGLPGADAIDAALHPADGPWLYFVPINLATGETVFSETADEHQAAVDQLLAWCDESAENATYCE